MFVIRNGVFCYSCIPAYFCVFLRILACGFAPARHRYLLRIRTCWNELRRIQYSEVLLWYFLYPLRARSRLLRARGYVKDTAKYAKTRRILIAYLGLEQGQAQGVAPGVPGGQKEAQALRIRACCVVCACIQRVFSVYSSGGGGRDIAGSCIATYRDVFVCVCTAVRSIRVWWVYSERILIV